MFDPLEYDKLYGAVPVKVKVKLVEDPLHKFVVPDKIAVGLGLTVTIGVPETSLAKWALQLFASVIPEIAKVLVLVGETEKVYGELVTFVSIVSFAPLKVYLTVQGLAPVNVTLKFVEAPLHIVAVPLKTEVGVFFTIRLPVIIVP